MQTNNALKEFSVSNKWWEGLWGGGHTAATDPSRQGWRAQAAKAGSPVLIIGRPGIPGAASVMQMTYGLDVAIYGDQTPEVVAKAVSLEPGDPGREVLWDAKYVMVLPTPGWGLRVLELIREDQ